ncbi:torsin-1A-like [Ornithodoros turicata]|uniref:torsin-1A-like n=1 Tax=Ornithodoros turicata TaxID=34597 RepID=UPI0031398B1F
MAKKAKSMLAITYPGYESGHKNCPPPLAEIPVAEIQWQKYQETLEPSHSKNVIPFSPTRKRWLWTCASVTWFLLHPCFYCCVALICLCMLSTQHPVEFDIRSLNETLRQNVIGQKFAVELTVNSIGNYLMSNNFTLPLVLLFVGCSGCGKTYTMSLISSTYPLSVELVVSHHMTPAHLAEKDFGKEIVHKLAFRQTNVITIDDVALNNDPLCHQLGSLFDKWDQVVTVRTEPTIFILSLSEEPSVVENYALLKLLSDEEENLSELQEEYRLLLPEWMSRFEVIPFVPMRQKHIAECIRRELANMNESDSEELVEKIMKEMHFYPTKDRTFSDSGCKAVPIKLALGKFRGNGLYSTSV